MCFTCNRVHVVHRHLNQSRCNPQKAFAPRCDATRFFQGFSAGDLKGVRSRRAFVSCEYHGNRMRDAGFGLRRDQRTASLHSFPDKQVECRVPAIRRSTVSFGRLLFALIVGFSAAVAAAQAHADAGQRASRHFESIRRQHPLLLAFLQEMPKGGDLHNHLSGAVYAETLIQRSRGARPGRCLLEEKGNETRR